MSAPSVCPECGGERTEFVQYHTPRCRIDRAARAASPLGIPAPPTGAPPASAPPLQVHTCTDPGPLLARIEELEGEIARLREAGNAVVDVCDHAPGCDPVYCNCGVRKTVEAWRALAGAAPKAETQRG